jgi:hypothetical protein
MPGMEYKDSMYNDPEIVNKMDVGSDCDMGMKAFRKMCLKATSAFERPFALASFI